MGSSTPLSGRLLVAAGPVYAMESRRPLYLDSYRDLLLQTEVGRELGPIDLPAALEQAVTVGLAALHPQLRHLAQVQPVLPYFLRSRLHGQPALRTATGHAHYQLYQQMAGNTGRSGSVHRKILSSSRPDRLRPGPTMRT